MSDEQTPDSPSVLDLFRDWYHVPVLLVTVLFMLWVRLRSYDNFIRDGVVYFSGNDAWYHLRQVNYTVRHWPFTMPFDPWTNFPIGTNAGQFGTLFDQLIATAALVVGLGSPSADLVAKTLLVAPAVFGALVAIPTYLVGKRVAGRLGALFGVAVLALLPGTFLRRGLVGFADHNVAEPFFQTFAVAATLVALAVAQREKPVWELVVGREWDALRAPALWSALAGVATALYMWAWPPGVLLVGIVGIFLVVKITGDYVNGVSPDHAAFVGAVSMGVAGIMMFVPFDTVSFGVTDFSLVQPLLSLMVAVGAVFLAWLARQFEGRDLDRWTYPAAVFGLVFVAAGVVAVVLPSLFDTVATNVLRTVGFSAGAETRTIAEAQPYLDPESLRQFGYVTQSGNPDRVGRLIEDYGFTLFTGVAAAIWMHAKPLVEDGDTRDIGYVVGSLLVVVAIFVVPAPLVALGDALGVVSEIVALAIVAGLIVGATFRRHYDPERLFVLVWAAFITAAAFTQIRFNYYLAVVVAVMNAYLLGEVVRSVDLHAQGSMRDLRESVSGYQVLVILAVVMLVAAPTLVVPMQVRNTGNPSFDSSETAWQAANNSAPGSVTQWDGSLRWMAQNTPPEGRYGGADNVDQFEYYGTFEQTDDYEYPDGTYGVMSWWDYGHWITVRGERVPNANPFQQGSTEAANFLLAPSETAGREVLQAKSTEGDRTQYVMVDWQMATPGSKFGAPVVFYDESNVSSDDFYHPVWGADFRTNFLHRHQRYYDSLMTRLYLYHGSRQEPQPVVVDWEERTAQTRTGEEVTVRTVPGGNQSVVRQFQNMSAAREYVREDGSAQVGGVGPFPSETVPALEHYRLVKVSNTSALTSPSYRRFVSSTIRTAGVPPGTVLPQSPAWVKTFERVPGATVEGSGALPNSTVRASVDMYVPTTNTTFTYVQSAETDENGEFSMTLPYSTTGYDEYGPESGYTNVSVRADGPYRLSTPAAINQSGYVVRNTANVSVEEGRVVGTVEGSKQVTLERQARPLFPGSGDSSANGNETEGGNASDIQSDVGPAASGLGDDARTDGGTGPSVERRVGDGALEQWARAGG